MKRTILTVGLMLMTSACAMGGPRGFGPGGPGGPGGPPPEGPGMAPPGGGQRMTMFISPMGEPFHAAPNEDQPQEMWFKKADADSDGAITVAEMRADAQRFFESLDRNRDGEIDPDEMTYYENVVAPEIRVMGGGMGGQGGSQSGRGPGGGGPGGGGGMGGGMGGPGGGGMGGGGGPGGGGGMGGPGGGSDAQRGGSGGGRRGARNVNAGSQGAARYGYLNLPQPVAAADRNFNRGIDPMEFQAAADARFLQLDTDHDGRLTRGELPQYTPQPAMGGMGGPPPGGQGGGQGGPGGPPPGMNGNDRPARPDDSGTGAKSE